MQRLNKFVGYLNENRFRVTQQRRRIAEAIFNAGGHLSADELCDMARKADPAVSRASVYRTLELMSRGGFVEGNAFGTDRKFYEAACDRRHHDHMVCENCGAVEEFHSERIESAQREIAARHGFETKWHSLRIHGLCRACSGKTGKKPKVTPSRIKKSPSKPSSKKHT